MRFSIISTVTPLAISAASLNKRDTSICVNDLGNAGTGICALTNYANGINASTNSLTSILSVYTYVKKLQTSVDTFQTSFCSLTAPLSSGEATTVLNRESTVASDFTSMSNAVVAKKSCSFGNLTQSTTPVLDCLTFVVPSDSQSTAEGYATAINGALQTLNSEFDNVAIPDTEVYPDTQRCINDLNSLGKILNATYSAIYPLSNTSGTSGFDTLQNQLDNEQRLSQTAATSCCAISLIMEERKAYLNPIKNADYQLKNDFIDLSDSANQFIDCFSKPNPDDIINGYAKDIPSNIQSINNIFVNATEFLKCCKL